MDSFHRITSKDYDKFLECSKIKLPTQVKTLIVECIKGYENFLISSLINCESPIEMLLAIALNNYTRSRLGYQLEFKHNLDILAITNQFDIAIGEQNFRADFFIAAKLNSIDEVFYFVIECDGHEFHERTKEQAARDKKRDRLLMSNGYHVIHFTGSEIFKSPGTCAQEVFNIILDVCKKAERVESNGTKEND
jgi:very-short-patch-repair endonuclease